jgi:hypothetical protein
MKTLKAICTAAILALALGVPVYAGDISSPGASAPSPGDVHIPGATSAAPGVIHMPGTPLTAPGDIDTPGLVDFFWTLISML